MADPNKALGAALDKLDDAMTAAIRGDGNADALLSNALAVANAELLSDESPPTAEEGIRKAMGAAIDAGRAWRQAPDGVALQAAKNALRTSRAQYLKDSLH